MSFAKEWPKLKKPYFTTFRYPRRDADWKVGETIQIFVKNRSPHRIFVGLAEIISRVPRVLNGEQHEADKDLAAITNEEAIADGFNNISEMEKFMIDYYGKDYSPAFNKLTIRRI